MLHQGNPHCPGHDICLPSSVLHSSIPNILPSSLLQSNLSPQPNYPSKCVSRAIARAGLSQGAALFAAMMGG